MNKFCLIWLIAVMSVLPFSAKAQILSVPSPAYPSIQSAIDAADNNDVIVVEPNTYYENINFLGKAIRLTSTDPNDPDIVAATVINGSLPTDPNCASVVTFNSGEGNNSILSGFTLTGGTGTWLTVAWRFHEVYWNRCGGGIVCYNLSQPTITKNIIRDNSAGEGGGIYIYGDPVNPNNPSDPAVHLTPVISQNTIQNNNAITSHGYEPPDTVYTLENHGDGGAIVCLQGVDPVITDNIIQNNHADSYGGGIHLRQWSNGLIENNFIQNNNSALGAGVHITYTSDTTIRSNTIQGNIAGGLGGGGIYVYYQSEPLIEYNLITQNTSTNGAGIGIYYESNAVIRNNLIVNNLTGAGVRLNGTVSAAITNNTIAGNIGGIECASIGTVVIQNNIIASNGGNKYGISAIQNLPVIHFNNVWQNGIGNYNSVIGDQAGTNGNISEDPLFLAVDDYHLNNTSPCINAGDPNYPAPAEETDYYREPRVLFRQIDIGADEVFPVWNVTTGNQYETIQQAIDEADDFDTIILTRGIHTGPGNRDLDFAGKPLTLQSTNPNNPEIVADTVIDAYDDAGTHRVFYFHSAENADSIINGLTITGGYGAYEGGGIKCYASSPTIMNCIIRNNRSIDHGGGIYCGYNSNPLIQNCLITENSFSPYGYGAGIYCYNSSSPTILNCIITNNVVLGNSLPGHGRHGGGICCWGASTTTPSNPVVANCIISGNIAEHRGGGVYAYWSSPVFVNCTITGNQSYEGGGAGSFREANPALYNCIVRDNIAEIGNQIALISTIRLWTWEEITEMTIANSNIEGWLSDEDVWVDTNMILHPGPGMIDTDPNFVDPGLWNNAGTPADPNDDYFIVGNYHLKPGSGCADTGENTFVPDLSIFDIDDETRIFNSTVDMGADEVTFSRGDFNTDGRVNSIDLNILAAEWLSDEMPLTSDLIDDDFINLEDFSAFAAEWLWTGQWIDR